MHAAIRILVLAFLTSGQALRSQETPVPATVSAASAQLPTAPPGKGHLQFINATGREGNVVFWVNNEVLSTRGYASGKATGTLALPEAALKIKGSLLGVGDAELSLPLKTGHLSLIIAKVEIEEKKDKPPVEKLVLQGQEFTPGQKREPSMIMMLQMTDVALLSVKFGGSDFILEHSKPQVAAVGSKMGLFPQLVFRNTALDAFNYREPAHRAVVLFTDKNGGLRTAPFSTLLP